MPMRAVRKGCKCVGDRPWGRRLSSPGLGRDGPGRAARDATRASPTPGATAGRWNRGGDACRRPPRSRRPRRAARDATRASPTMVATPVGGNRGGDACRRPASGATAPSGGAGRRKGVPYVSSLPVSVCRRTSSTVVWPFDALRRPSWSKVRWPCSSWAKRFRSIRFAPETIISWSSLVIGTSS